MTTAGLEPATFWYRWAIEAKRATIALGSLDQRRIFGTIDLLVLGVPFSVPGAPLGSL